MLLLLAVSMPAFLPASGSAGDNKGPSYSWTAEEKNLLRSLSLSSLPPLPKDPSNAYADDPKAVELGRKFFFDRRFSANKKVSCATCHIPENVFTDKLPLARGMGRTNRRTMPLAGTAYQAWFFWDGRKDSLWSQAVGPIESSVEHGFTRSLCAHLIKDHYKKEYEEIFGPLPVIDHKSCPPEASPGTGSRAALRLWNAMNPEDREKVNIIYSNIGKAIAAFVRRILPLPARFDMYADALVSGEAEAAERLMTPEEKDGLRLFIGRAACINCHNGPLLSNSVFHNVGELMPKDRGRAEGIGKVLDDEFNCLGKYSDARPEQCAELKFIDKDSSRHESAFKTPSLRNVAQRPPYMHAGQIKTLAGVLEFYRSGGSQEIAHPGLADDELKKIEAFLNTLSGPISYPK